MTPSKLDLGEQEEITRDGITCFARFNTLRKTLVMSDPAVFHYDIALDQATRHGKERVSAC